MNTQLVEQGKELVDKLSLIKDDYIASKNELKYSIRRDVVAAELKDILASNADIHCLKDALENYVSKLMNMNT